jgi:hypothetical protein
MTKHVIDAHEECTEGLDLAKKLRPGDVVEFRFDGPQTERPGLCDVVVNTAHQGGYDVRIDGRRYDPLYSRTPIPGDKVPLLGVEDGNATHPAYVRRVEVTRRA